MTMDKAGGPVRFVPGAGSESDIPLEVGVVGGTRLALEMTEQWLRRISPRCCVHHCTEPAGLFQQAEAHPGLDIVILADYLHSTEAESLVDTASAIRDRLPTVPMVVVTGAEDSGLIYSALCHGIRGYIPIRLPVELAVAAVKLVLLGGTFAPPLGGHGAFDVPGSGRGPTVALEDVVGDDRVPSTSLEQVRLSPREQEVLNLLQVGSSNRQIATRLRISENTVMVHVRHLMRKLGATNRTQAVCRINDLLKVEQGANA